MPCSKIIKLKKWVCLIFKLGELSVLGNKSKWYTNFYNANITKSIIPNYFFINLIYTICLTLVKYKQTKIKKIIKIIT